MTFASVLRADRREGGDYVYDEWHSFDSSCVEQVIDRMDQWLHTEASLLGKDWWFALIGGGSGAYLVSIENQMTGIRFQLVDPDRSEVEMVEIVAGGQRGRSPARMVVGTDAALRAARHFAETGEPDPALHWVEEQSG